jgi:1,4-alpha-glucan branching enzyme
VLQFPIHSGLQKWVKDLNAFYRSAPALYEIDSDYTGFEWIDCHDRENSVVSFLRRGKNQDDVVVVVCNFTPVPRVNYRVGVPFGGWWREALNSDAGIYGGSNVGNGGGVMASDEPSHGRPCSLSLTLPPLAAVVLRSS